MSGFDLAEKVKICVLGETVGKSALIHAFLDEAFSGQQIEHQNMQQTHHKQIKLLKQTFDLEILDTTNNNDVESTYDDMLQIEWKGMDGYSMGIRKSWILDNDVLFLLFNRLNKLSWMILQAMHEVALQYLSDNVAHVPIYIISTCSDLYLSQSSLSNLNSLDLVSFKEVTEYVSKFENVFHFETSAKMDHNIDAVFKSAIANYDVLCPPKIRKKKKRKRKKAISTLNRNNQYIDHKPLVHNAEPTDTCTNVTNRVIDDKYIQKHKSQEMITQSIIVNNEETKLDKKTEDITDDTMKHDEDNDNKEDKEKEVHMNSYIGSPRSESSLSSKEIYNIEYSSKYKESMDFKNIQKTFNKYYQIKVSYAQIEDTNPDYKSSTLLFFKDLDATLSTIGCVDDDKKTFFIQCRQYIIYKMMHQIHLMRHRYEYLQTITLLTAPMVLRLKEVQHDDYWNILRDASFVSKLHFSYELWTKDSKKSSIEFKNEIAGALHINPIYIQINGVGKGLDDIVIDWSVKYVWIPYYIQGVQTDLIRREYRMRPQDQIEVKYKNEWMPCTVVEVKDGLNSKGKRLKVRYNKLNGKDRFKTKNTEWIWSIKGYGRLRLPDNVYVIVSYNGIKIGSSFKPPLLAYCRDGNKQYIDIGHHIFVNRNSIWYRCEVIDAVLEGKKIQILYLVHTFLKNTEWLRLWEPADLQRISLENMRM